jgi:hypothetical protein
MSGRVRGSQTCRDVWRAGAEGTSEGMGRNKGMTMVRVQQRARSRLAEESAPEGKPMVMAEAAVLK